MQDKESIRRFVWRLLEEKKVTMPPKPVEGRIPNFVNAERAAENLARLKEWEKAEILKVNPDSPQRPVRERALLEGKKVIMPSPRLREGFVLLDPRIIPRKTIRYASTIRGAMILGKRLSLSELRSLGSVDLIVEGSVAVNLMGERIGKGGGYGDLEYAILREIGLADENTPITTTVHGLQVLKEKFPQDPWDVSVDIIVTSTRVYRVLERRARRPRGILWEYLDHEKIRSIPLLAELRASGKQ